MLASRTYSRTDGHRPAAVRLRTLLHELSRPQARAAYMFVAPSLLTLGVFLFLPILQAARVSFQDWRPNGSTTWVGLDNYRRLLDDERAIDAFQNTFYYAAVVVPVSTLLSLLLAIVLNERLLGRTVFKACYYLPAVASLAVVAFAFRFMLDPNYGVLGYWSKVLHLPSTQWLKDPDYALVAVMAVGVWKSLGFFMVIFLAGLQGIPDSLHEAARIDGAAWWRRQVDVSLPLLRPTILFVLIIATIGACQVFDQAYVMTPNGGPLFSTETVLTYTYYQGIELFRLGYANAISFVLFVALTLFTITQLVVFRFRESDQE